MNVTLSRHFVYLACSYQNLVLNSKACLIVTTHEGHGCRYHYANAKIPEISVGRQMEKINFGFFRPEYSGHFGITSGGGPLISVGLVRPKFDKPVHCRTFLHLCRELEKI